MSTNYFCEKSTHKTFLTSYDQIRSLDQRESPHPWKAKHWHYLKNRDYFRGYSLYVLRKEGNLAKIWGFCLYYGGVPQYYEWELMKIVLHSTFQNKGFGSFLFKSSLRELKKEGFLKKNRLSIHPKIYLQVSKSNGQALRAYENWGFVQTRSLENYYGHGEHAVEMMREDKVTLDKATFLEEITLEAISACAPLELYHFEYLPVNSRLVVTLMDPGTTSCSLEQCVAVTKKMNARIAEEESLEDLELEVTSPGIFRKLYTQRHFQLALNEVVMLTIKGKESNLPKKLRGVLKEVDVDGMIIENLGPEIQDESPNQLKIPFDKVVKARLDPEV